MGALKFNNNLPWDIDADISVETSNLTAFRHIVAPILRRQRFAVVSNDMYGLWTMG